MEWQLFFLNGLPVQIVAGGKLWSVQLHYCKAAFLTRIRQSAFYMIGS